MIQDYNRECQSVAANNNQQQHNNIIKNGGNLKMRSLAIYLKNYRKESILAPFFKFLEVVFDLLVPVVIAQIIDVGITGNDPVYHRAIFYSGTHGSCRTRSQHHRPVFCS